MSEPLKKDSNTMYIESIQKQIENINNSIKENISLLYKYISCSEAKNEKIDKKLMKYKDKIRDAKNEFSLKNALKSTIDFIESYKKENIHFYLDFEKAVSIIYNGNIKSAKPKPYTENIIENICNEILHDLSRKKELKQELNKALRDNRKKTTVNKNENGNENTNINITKLGKRNSTTKEATEKNTNETNTNDITDEIKKIKDACQTRLKDIIDPLIKNYEISKKYSGLITKYNPHDILDYALNVYTILPTYLEEKHTINQKSIIELYNKFKIKDSLDEYERIYNKYMSAYSRMFPSNKKEQDRLISEYNQKPTYKNIFGERDFSSPSSLIKPEELRKIVNKKIIKDAKEKKGSFLYMTEYFYSDNEIIGNNAPDLKNITAFMEIEEVVRLYETIKNTWSPVLIEENEDNEIVTRSYRTFQERIVKLIVKKFYKKEINNLSEEQISEYIKNNYNKICNEVLEEEPIIYRISSYSSK